MSKILPDDTEICVPESKSSVKTRRSCWKIQNPIIDFTSAQANRMENKAILQFGELPLFKRKPGIAQPCKNINDFQRQMEIPGRCQIVYEKRTIVGIVLPDDAEICVPESKSSRKTRRFRTKMVESFNNFQRLANR